MSTASQIATAKRLLSKHGQDMQLTVGSGSPVYDPATSSLSTAGGLLFNTRGAEFDCTEREIDGTNILRGDKNVILPSINLLDRVAVGSRITFGGITYRIMHSSPLAPSGVPVIHQLRVRA